MIVSDFLTRLNYVYRGLDDDTPTVGDDDATYWLDTFNRKKDELYEDVTKQWSFSYKETAPSEPGTVATSGTTTLTGTSTFFTDYAVGDKITVSGETVRTIATITSDTSLTVTVAFSNTASGKTFTHNSVIATGVQTYNLHRYFLGASSQAYVVKTDGKREYFTIIQPQARDDYKQEVFISDETPQSVTFTNDIESTHAIVGGILYVPGYFKPGDVSAATDVIPLPDPNWGVMATAAELAFNDITYEDKAGDLNAKANNLYKMMENKNRRGTYRNPTTSPTKVKRIRGY